VCGFIVASFLPFRHILNYAEACRYGWYSELLAISLYGADLFFLLCLIILILPIILAGSYIHLWNKERNRVIIITASLLFLFAEALRNANVLLGIYTYSRITQLFILIICLNWILRKRDARIWICATLVAIGLFQATLGLFQVSSGHSLGLHYLGEQTITVSMPGVAKVDLGNGNRLLRAYGTMPHPNILGGFFVLSLSALYLLYKKTVIRRIFLIFTLFMLIFGLILTFSRSAELSFAVLVCFVLYLNRHAIGVLPIRKILLLPITLLTLLYIFTPVGVAVWHRIVPTANDFFISDRIILFSNGYKVFRDNFLLGTGLGNYLNKLLKVCSPEGTGFNFWQYDYPHSAAAEIFIETGLVGLIIFILVFYTLFGQNKLKIKEIALTLVVISPLLFLDHYLWTNQAGRVTLALFMALIPSLININRTTRISESAS
jgi:hypothetical protein